MMTSQQERTELAKRHVQDSTPSDSDYMLTYAVYCTDGKPGSGTGKWSASFYMAGSIQTYDGKGWKIEHSPYRAYHD